MRANVLSKQILEPKMTGLSSQQFSHFLRSKVGKTLLGLFIFSAIQLAFGAVLPNAFSVAPNAAYGLSVQEALPAGTEVSVEVDAVVVSFAQPMDVAQSLPAADLRIDGSAGVGFDLINASWDMTGLVLTLPLTGELEWETAYTVNIGGLNSALGIPMFFAHTHIFMTEVNPLGGISQALGGTSPIEKLAAGIYHSIALHEDGTLWAWGDNTHGQLGLGIADNPVMAPTPIDMPAAVNSWEYIAAGYYHTLAICDEGELWAWGRNHQGQLGLGTNTARELSPSKVDRPSDAGDRWIAVDAGQHFTIALCEDGYLWSWGNNAFGQLGRGPMGVFQSTPGAVEAPASGSEWTNFAVGAFHVIAAREGGSLWAWGHNHGGHTSAAPPQTPTLAVPTAISHPEIAGVMQWQSLAAGAYHSLALCEGGYLWAWGLNSRGQLGVDSITNDFEGHPADIRTTPQLIETSSEWIDVVAGYTHTLGLCYDGILWAWGFNQDGQLGIGGSDSYAASPTSVDVPTGSEWNSLAAGYHHTLALCDDGELWAWGSNNRGQLGKGVTGAGAGIDNTAPWRFAASLIPTSETDMTVANNATIPNRGATDVEDDTITIRFNRPMYTGEDSSNARTGVEVPGTITIVNELSGDIVQVISADEGEWSEDNTVFTATMNLTASEADHKAEVEGFVDDFLKTEMHSHDWTFTTGEIEAAVELSASRVAAGIEHTVVLLEDGTLWAWGSNSHGQLGMPGGNRLAPTQVPDPLGVEGEYWTAVSAGANHTVALRDDGTLYTWGANGEGQLGIGTTGGTVSTPTEVSNAVLNGGHWVAVSTGPLHTLALCSEGYIYTWGVNTAGQLGIGVTGASVNVPQPVDLLTNSVSGERWVAISDGHNHTLALRNHGALYAWGVNGSRQLGIGPITGSQSAPRAVDISALGAVVWTDNIFVGQNHTLAICANGELYAWGANANRQLGVAGGTGERSVPTLVPATGLRGDDWTAVSAGLMYTVAMRDGKYLYAWGNNAQGQLGTGTASNVLQETPVEIPAPTGAEWVAVWSGHNHVLAACSDGALWSWGNNASGQLGKGFTDSPVGANNAEPWRIAASVRSDDSIPAYGDVDVTDNTITIRFDRPMRTAVGQQGIITVSFNDGTNEIYVDISAGTWVDDRTFTATMDLTASNTVHTVTVQGFVDDFLGQKGSNEMHDEYCNTWTFTTGEIKRIDEDIVFTDSACATCHFTESVRIEHQFVQSRGITDCENNNDYEYGCQKCHGQEFSDVEKVNWSRLSDCVDLSSDYPMSEAGCMSCHNFEDTHVGDTDRMLEAHVVADVPNPGCSAAGCHGDSISTGFGFGALDLASAHADYWIAVRDDRAEYPSDRSEYFQKEENSFDYGCGICHVRGDAESQSRLRAEIQTHLENENAFGNITCGTCHVASFERYDPDWGYHLVQRMLVQGLDDLLEPPHPQTTSATVTNLLRSLSAQVRAELGLELEGESLEPGVLEPICPVVSEAPMSIESTIAVGAFSIGPGWCGPDCELCGVTGHPSEQDTPSVPSIPTEPDNCSCQYCEDNVNCPGCVLGACACAPTTQPCSCLTGGICNCDDCNCDPVSCTCTTAAEETTPTVSAEETTPTVSAEETTPTASPRERDPNAGPATGELNNWFAQIAVVAFIVATIAATGLIRTRKEQV